MILPSGVQVAWRAVPPRASRRDTSRALLAELLPGGRFVSRCPLCGGDHGRIRVAGLDAAVSVSYVSAWTVVAVTRECRRIGVDAVPADAVGLERVLPGGTDARAWARAEAVLKADGRGLTVDPAHVSVREGADGWWARVIDHPGGQNSTAEWRGWDLDGPEGVVAALAVPAETEVIEVLRPSSLLADNSPQDSSTGPAPPAAPTPTNPSPFPAPSASSPTTHPHPTPKTAPHPSDA